MGSNQRDIRWQRDVTPAAWLAARLHPFNRDAGSIVPDGFAALARIFHPLCPEDHLGYEHAGQRWSEIARENGRCVHADMQLEDISRPPGTARTEPRKRPSVGTLPPRELRALVDILAEETTTPGRCWFCVWDSGSIDDQGVTERVVLPGRRYLMHGGDIEMAFASPRRVGAATSYWRSWSTPKPTTEPTGALEEASPPCSPNLWWPEDRAWCVATEIDFGWSYVAGSPRAIARVLASPALEALLARWNDNPHHDGDWLNRTLDAPLAGR